MSIYCIREGVSQAFYPPKSAVKPHSPMLPSHLLRLEVTAIHRRRKTPLPFHTVGMHASHEDGLQLYSHESHFTAQDHQLRHLQTIWQHTVTLKIP